MEVSKLLSATRRCSLRRLPISEVRPASLLPDTLSSRRFVSAPIPAVTPACKLSPAVMTPDVQLFHVQNTFQHHYYKGPQTEVDHNQHSEESMLSILHARI